MSWSQPCSLCERPTSRPTRVTLQGASGMYHEESPRIAQANRKLSFAARVQYAKERRQARTVLTNRLSGYVW